jgi:sec-independent protein translocase protein TatC
MISISKEAFIENIQELKSRLIKCLVFFFFVVGILFFSSEKFLSYFTAPLINAIKSLNGQLVYTNIVEPFSIRMNLSITLGIFFSLPFFLWQAYSFISPGLYSKEKRIILPYMFFSPAFFCIGISFVYYLMFPNAWHFFSNFSYEQISGEKINMMLMISDYINLCIKMMIMFGLAFQFPIILSILINLQVLSTNQLKKARRFVIVAVFIVSAVLTPPEIMSQILLAIPLLLIYEGIIIYYQIKLRSK